MTEQDCFTSIVDIDPEKEDSLRRTLREIDEQVRAGVLTAGQSAIVPFEDLTTVHYARWVILLSATNGSDGEKYPAQLAFSTDFDGTKEAHLDELCRVAGPGLDKVYSHCKGYTADSPEKRRRYFEASHVPPHTFYVGRRQRTRDQIREEAELRSKVVEYIAQRQRDDPDWPRGQLEQARREIGDYVASLPPLGTTLAPPLRRRTKLVIAGLLVAVALIGLFWKLPLLAGVVALLLVLLSITLRYKETTDLAFQGSGSITVTPEEREQIREAAQHENFELQNQLTHLVEIKPGIARQLYLRVALLSVHLLARNWFYKGKLGGIPSIHFARWMIVNGGKRLLFFSNFDGSWQNYLGDFIDKAAVGLTGIWSNTRLFPRSRCLLWDGARDEERFKAWARIHQIDTQVWYVAVPGLSVPNVNRNTELRRMLEDPGSIPDLHWLRMW